MCWLLTLWRLVPQDAELKAYVEHGEGIDRAGGFAIQVRLFLLPAIVNGTTTSSLMCLCACVLDATMSTGCRWIPRQIGRRRLEQCRWLSRVGVLALVGSALGGRRVQRVNGEGADDGHT